MDNISCPKPENLEWFQATEYNLLGVVLLLPPLHPKVASLLHDGGINTPQDSLSSIVGSQRAGGGWQQNWTLCAFVLFQ